MSDTIGQDMGQDITLRHDGGSQYSYGARGLKPKRVSATLTRPGDTTQYAAGDQVSGSTITPTALEFANIVPASGEGFIITDAVCVDSFNQATKPSQELYLFAGTAAPTANNDNAPWLPSDADLNNSFACLSFGSWYVGGTAVGSGGNCASYQRNLGITVEAGAAVSSIWGLVVERSTYTPGSAEAFKFTLGILPV